MKAWELRGFGRENLALTDKPIAEPSPTEVLVRVGAVSLNYRDKLLVQGFYNPGMRFPMTQAADAVGQVVEIGGDVTRSASSGDFKQRREAGTRQGVGRRRGG